MITESLMTIVINETVCLKIVQRFNHILIVAIYLTQCNTKSKFKPTIFKSISQTLMKLLLCARIAKHTDCPVAAPILTAVHET